MKIIDGHQQRELKKQLFLAIDQHDNDEAKRLIEQDEVDINAFAPRFKYDYKKPINIPCGFTPLMFAIRKNNPVLFSYFLDQGADTYVGGYAVSNDDEPEAFPVGTALHIASQGRLAMLRELLDRGMAADYTDRNDYPTPLANLCLYFQPNYLDSIKLLVERGADVKRLDTRGNNMLYRAMVLGNQTNELLWFLISRGIDIDHQNNQGKTVFDLDRPFKNTQIPNFNEGMAFLKKYHENKKDSAYLKTLLDTPVDRKGDGEAGLLF